MIGPAILVAPWLFGVEIASAAAYTKAKNTNPVITVSGNINAAVRKADNGETGRQYSNALVGQMGPEESLSHIQVFTKTQVGNLDLLARARVIARFNAFSSMTENNAYIECNTGISLANQYVYHPSCVSRVHFDLFEVVISDRRGKFGQISLGKAPTATRLSSEANFTSTSYTRADVSNMYSVRLGVTGTADYVGRDFGSYKLNHDQFRVQYTTAEYIKGFNATAEYVSQSDQRTNIVANPLYPRYDSTGFSANYRGNLNDVDIDARVGYTSRALEGYYRNGVENDFPGTNGSWHVRGLGASAAVKYQGIDASVAYVKLDPKGFLNRATNNFAQNALTNKYGQKAAVMNSFELGYTFEAMDRDLGISGEYATSKNFHNDGSKATIKGVRLARKCTDNLTLHAVAQDHSAKGYKVLRSTNVYGEPKNVKVRLIGFSYSF